MYLESLYIYITIILGFRLHVVQQSMTFFCKDGIVYITATLEKSLVAFLNDGWISDTSYASWPHVFRTGPWERI